MDINARFALFLLGCIPVRSGLVVAAHTLPAQKLPIMGYAALLPAIGFSSIFLMGARKTGAETGGQPIYWNAFRPLHAALYFIFAWMAIRRDPQSWVPLLVDVVLGLCVFLAHHSLSVVEK